MTTPETPAVSGETKLAEYKALRSSIKGNISCIKNKVLRADFEASSKEDVACRLEILHAYYKQVVGVQVKIDAICAEAERESNETAIADIEEMYILAKVKLNGLLDTHRPSIMDTSILNHSVMPVSKVQRQLKVPKFEGKYSEYPKFAGLFSKLVDHDSTLDHCVKFLILKESLGPRPLQCIADFDETEENYPKALKRLKEIFDKKMLMFEEHVGALFCLDKMMS